MSEIIECIFDGESLHPLKKLPYQKGEHISIRIERRLSFEPIPVKTILTTEAIKAFREESWTSL